MISITFADFKKQHTENQWIIIDFAYNHTCMIVCKIVVRKYWHFWLYHCRRWEYKNRQIFLCILPHYNTHKISVLHIMLIISILCVLLLRFNILLKCSRMSNGITDYGKLSIYWLLYWSQYLHFTLVRTTISNHTIKIKPRTWNLFNRLPVWKTISPIPFAYSYNTDKSCTPVNKQTSSFAFYSNVQWCWIFLVAEI